MNCVSWGRPQGTNLKKKPSSTITDEFMSDRFNNWWPKCNLHFKKSLAYRLIHAGQTQQEKYLFMPDLSFPLPSP